MTRINPIRAALMTSALVGTMVLPVYVAAQCNEQCWGFYANTLQAYSRVRGGHVVNITTSGTAPQWMATWQTDCLTPAGDAWEVGTALSVSLSAFEPSLTVVLVTENWPYGDIPAGTTFGEQPVGGTETTSKFTFINLDLTKNWYWLWWAGTAFPPNGYIDLTSVLAHEIGHALGLGHAYEGMEFCTVMTPILDNQNGETTRTIRSWDMAAINCYYPAVSVGDISSFTAIANGHNTDLSFTLSNHPEQYPAVYVGDNPKGPAQ